MKSKYISLKELETEWWKYLDASDFSQLANAEYWHKGSSPITENIDFRNGVILTKNLYDTKDVSLVFSHFGIKMSPNSFKRWKGTIFTSLPEGASRTYISPIEAYYEAAKTLVFRKFRHKRKLIKTQKSVKTEKPKAEKPVLKSTSRHLRPDIGEIVPTPYNLMNFNDVVAFFNFTKEKAEELRVLISDGKFIQPYVVLDEPRWFREDIERYVRHSVISIISNSGSLKNQKISVSALPVLEKDDAWLKTKEAAAVLGCAESTLRHYPNNVNGILKKYYNNNFLWYKKSEIEMFKKEVKSFKTYKKERKEFKPTTEMEQITFKF